MTRPCLCSTMASEKQTLRRASSQVREVSSNAECRSEKPKVDGSAPSLMLPILVEQRAGYSRRPNPKSWLAFFPKIMACSASESPADRMKSIGLP